MAELDRTRWLALDPLLDQALELSDEARGAWLAELRAESPTVAAELTQLLALESSADRSNFLDAPIASGFATSLDGAFTGLRLGGYSIERQLGEGGMGTVWLARRVDGRFEGQVAVKFLNLSLSGETGRERFRREGTMLGSLAHPNIARLLDAGVADGGQPCLVLEYVEGEPIDAYADSRALGVDERIGLVLQVLAAVDHAHARLIVHRDLKPTNILVDANGESKLLDFGIAKLLGDDDRAALTHEGQRILTPEYAAPEQLLGQSVTTATDVYAVGVLLYLLLTGRRPHDVAGRSFGELERIISGVEPLRPSETLGIGADDRAERAELRGTSSDRLQRQLRGDLDAIVAKAMHKEPARRYQSAKALADDLQRYLDGRPVVARPDGALYRLRKFVGRHRAAVAVAIGAVALVIGGGLRERSLRARAESEARKARAVEEYLVSVFDVADPYAPPGQSGANVTARALLDRGAARVDTALAADPDVQAELRSVLGRVYGSLGLYENAAPLLQRALEQRKALYGPRHVAVAEAMDLLGQVLASQNRFDEAESLLRGALEQRRALLPAASADVAASLDHLATLLQERGQLVAAEPLFREAVTVRRAVHGNDDVEVANALNNYALVLYLRGAYDAADPLYRESLAIETRRLGENHPRTAQVIHNLAQLQHMRGRFVEAETLYRRALAAKRKSLGDAHPSVTVNLNNLGLMLAQELGRVAEGEVLIREALMLDRRVFGPQHSYVAESMRNLSTVLRLKGDFVGSEKTAREALAMNTALFGTESRRFAGTLQAIALVRQLQGDVVGAIPLYRRAASIFERTSGLQHVQYNGATTALGRALREHGELVEAEQVLRSTLARLDTTSRPHRPLLISAEVALGETLVDQHRAQEAQPLLERGIVQSVERFGDGDWRTAEARLALGRALAARGRTARAVTLVGDALITLQRYRRAQPLLYARASAEATALGARS